MKTAVIREKHRIKQKGKTPSRKDVHLMFDRIAHRYDFLNHFLSFGTDIRWRRKTIKALALQPDNQVLDLACGTADLALTVVEKLDSRGRIIGIDLSFEMLKLAKLKIEDSDSQTPIDLIRGNGIALPLQDNCFDAAMIAFGIRNMPDTLQCLCEIRRVLKPNGKLAVLEFSLPRNKIIKTFYLLYFRHILPFIGKLLSGDSYAYSYLNKTAETYYQGKEFCSLLEEAGFNSVSTKSLTLGVATIYRGDKK